MENLENVNVEEQELENVEQEEQDEKETVDLLDLLEKDDNIKSQFQSEVDRMISKAIQTREKKHQEELKKQEQRAKMTAEELQHEKERELAEKEAKLAQYELGLKKVEYFKNNNIDMALIDYIYVDSEEDIEEKATGLMAVIDEVVSKKVKEKLKEDGYSTPKENENVGGLSLEDLKGKSPEEINELWNNVSI